jgi:hypothetical protein
MQLRAVEMNDPRIAKIHARHADDAKYYEISSVLKPGKSNSLDPNDRINRKACEVCGFVAETPA